jgi:hypothetical protein
MPLEHPEEQPDGIIFSGDFNIEYVPPDASLFFDDSYENIWDVQKHVNKDELKLQSVFCPPGPIAWHDAKGRIFNSVADYRSLKSLDVTFSHDFRRFIEKDKLEVGNGLTPGMIRQIIEYDQFSDRIYFFDFDMVLNQLSGLDFSFLSIPTDNDLLLKQYAKYIFSDHIGPELPGGRLTLLQTMFRTIGPERIYVITSNSFANQKNLKNGVMIDNPYLNHFIAILRILLPTFNPNHLVCTNSKNQPPLYNKKSAAIIDILNERETMRKPQSEPRSVNPQSEPRSVNPRSVNPQSEPRSVNPQSEPRSVNPQSEPRSVKPQSVKPQSVIAKKSVKPKSAIAKVKPAIDLPPRVLRSSVRKRKGGSKRRMRVRCTRRKRRITG